MIRFTAILIAVFAFSFPAQAKNHHRHHHHHIARVHIAESKGFLNLFQATLPSRASSQRSQRAGNVVSHKTGAQARVGSAYAAQFQAYIDDLEANGAIIRFMGGIRPGRCWSGGMHPCGKALDVCQYSRDRVDARCHLPSRSTIASIADRHGLFEGGQWCHGDLGHAQVGISAGACGTTFAARRHRHHRHASR